MNNPTEEEIEVLVETLEDSHKELYHNLKNLGATITEAYLTLQMSLDIVRYARSSNHKITSIGL